MHLLLKGLLKSKTKSFVYFGLEGVGCYMGLILLPQLHLLKGMTVIETHLSTLKRTRSNVKIKQMVKQLCIIVLFTTIQGQMYNKL
jgi:hypothetical protein